MAAVHFNTTGDNRTTVTLCGAPKWLATSTGPLDVTCKRCTKHPGFEAALGRVRQAFQEQGS